MSTSRATTVAQRPLSATMPPAPDNSVGEFSLAEARRIVGNHFRPSPWIYWTDFLLSWSVGVACFGLVLHPDRLTSQAAWHAPLTVAMPWPKHPALAGQCGGMIDTPDRYHLEGN